MTALLQTPLPMLNDRPVDRLPESLTAVVDAHVYLFSDFATELEPGPSVEIVRAKRD